MQITTESSVASMNKPKISIIVPVYNTELYLRECIESILRQSFMNFEVLLVDDGSTDASGSICEDYAAKDTRIRVFHQTNQGVTAARKCGILHSNGEYLCFVDSDDTINLDALAVLADALLGNIRDIDAVVSSANKDAFISGHEYVRMLLENEKGGSLWGNLYKRSLFKNCRSLDLDKDFPIGEDYITNLELGLKMKRIVCITASIYNYRYNPASVMHVRTYTLAYEEKFRKTVEKTLGSEIENFEEAWYKCQLRTLENLIVRRVRFSYDRPWIHKLLKTRHNYSLTLRQKIILRVRHAVLCRYLLGIEVRIKERLKCK